MELIEFAQQIEDLLYMGVIQGKQILQMHHLLKSYQQRMVSAEVVQAAIDDCRPIDL
jgi:hypothetical protein